MDKKSRDVANLKIEKPYLNCITVIAPPIIVRYNIVMESSSVGSERLRRALERNRAKRARQEGSRSERMQSRLGNKRPLAGRRPLPLPGGAGQQRPMASPSPSSPSPLPLRRPEPVLDKAPTAAPTQTRSPRMSRFFSGLWEYLLRLAWLFCGVLILRLVFTNGGVVDFYAKRDHLQSKEREYLSIKGENKEILAEIDKIKTSSDYQKKLVRKHLEFIAPDEFLILFAKEGGRKAP